MSDTNRVDLSIARNSERDEPITLSPNELRQLRYTGTPGLAFAPNSVISDEIRSDRQIADSILVGASAGGNANIELSFGTFDLLLESTMLSTFVDSMRKDGATEIVSFGAGTVTVDDGTDFIIAQIIMFRVFSNMLRWLILWDSLLQIQWCLLQDKKIQFFL